MSSVSRGAHSVLQYGNGLRRVGIVFALLSLSALTVSAQTYVFGRADFAVGKDPSSLTTGDFNGDGILDLVVTNFTDNTVSVLLGKPDGTFAAQATYSTGSEPVAVATGDFNGDGNLDLVVANENCQGQSCSASGVSILLGVGDGTFQPRADYPTGTGPAAVGVADFNGDGKLDIALVNSVDGTVSILLGNSDGTFQSAVAYTITGGGASAPSSIVIADFNGDHRLDLVAAVGNETGTPVSILLGNGDGTFAKPIGFSSNAGGSLATADFNHDNKFDLAIAGNGSIEVYLGNGDGTFALNATYSATYGDVMYVSDFNADGKPDLALSGPAPSNYGSFSVISILLGNGDGTFQTATPYGTELATLGLVAADFNGDGEMDLALTDSGAPGYVSVQLGNGDGTFVAKMYPSPGSGLFSSFINTSADFNNDGKLDLVIADTAVDSVSVFLGNGDGTFNLSATTFPTPHAPRSVAAGDFRNDGITDLAVFAANCFTPPCNGELISILLGNGDGTFQSHVDYSLDSVAEDGAIVAGDFRGNHKLDLAVVDESNSSSVSILLGNGDGTFQPHVDYVTLQGHRAITTGDFNGDGKLDLLVCTAYFVSVLLGNGDGTFQTHVDSLVDRNGGACAQEFGVSPMATGDFNGDGKLDLAVSDIYYKGLVTILLGNGDGTFQPPVTYADGTLSGVATVAAADYNGDGKLDLAVAGVFDGNMSLLLGNGDGTFQGPILYPVLLNPGDFLQLFAVGDFNGDGAPDWAFGEQTPGQELTQIWVMLGSFKAVSPTSLHFGSQGVGTTSATQNLIISNPTNVPVAISGVTVGGDFSKNTNCEASLKPGANCTVSLTFSPTAIGLAQGKITITDSTRSTNQAILVTGTGVDGPFLMPYPRRLSFAAEAIGAKSTPAAVTLVNTGNASVRITAIGVTGPDSSDFSQTNNCGSSLAVGGSCAVKVEFMPGAGGSRTASIAISDSAPGSPQGVALSGIATGLGLAIAPGGSNSAAVTAGQKASYSLTIGGAGFSGSATLTCTGAPKGATCSVPANVNVTTTASPLAATVTTTSRTMAILMPGNSTLSPWFYAIGLVGLMILPGAGRGNRRIVRFVRSCPLQVMLVLFCSCGNGGGSSGSTLNPNGTPPGTYPLTVKATSGSTSQSISLTLIVQ